jgi:hypothetical protein
VAALVLLVPATMQTAWGQALTGSIVGNVLDNSGAAVPGAEVTITETGKQQVRNALTDAVGRYDFEAVQPGVYDVSISKPGFRTATTSQVTLIADQVSRVDTTLEIGNVTETVNVSATAAVLQADSAVVASDLSSTQLESVPLSQNRNFQDLLVTVPGYALAANTHSFVANPSNAYSLSSSGNTTYGNSTRIDGAEVTQSFQVDVVAMLPTLDSIETVNVATNSFEAQTGAVAGGSVAVITKSGTNDLHGSLFEEFTSDHLKSRPFFLPANQPLGRLTRNQYGGSLGGRIIRNKLFYFASYEGLFNSQVGESNWTVPDALEHAGNFSESTTPIYDPATGSSTGSGRTPFTGNLIPTSRIDPIALKLNDMLPLPNVPGAVGAAANNYGATGDFYVHREQLDTKLTWNPTSRLSIFQKTSVLQFYEDSPAVFGPVGGNAIVSAGGISGIGQGKVWALTSAATYILSPTMVLDGHFSWETDYGTALPHNYGVNAGQALGIPGTNGPDKYQSGWPLFSVGSYAVFGNSSNEVPYYRDNGVHQYDASLGWTKGAHSLRFGGETLRRHMENLPGSVYPQGSFTFGTGPTQVSGGPSGNQYNAWAGFLLGLATGASKTGVIAVPPSLYSGNNNFDFYAQDRWAISRKLTASLGVRWDYFGFPYVPYFNHNGPGLYDIASNSVQICGYKQVPQACGVTMPRKLFSPSIGLAYRLTPSLVVRAGYSISQVPLTMENAVNPIYPAEFTANAPQANSLVWASTLQVGSPAVVAPSLGNGIIPNPPNNVAMTIFPKSWVWPYEQSWNVTLQKQINNGLSATVAYVGNNTIHLCLPGVGASSKTCQWNLNAGQFIGTGTAGQPFFANQGRSAAVNLWAPKGTEKYYALQSRLSQSLSHGFMMTASYTWSKTFAPNFFTDAALYQSVNADALQSMNRTHVLTASTVYDLPFGKGKPWFSNNRMASAVAGGWKISSLAIFATGLPFNISSSATPLNLVGATTNGNQILPHAAITHNIGGSWFDPLAFAPITTPNFGNVGYNSMTGPGVVNVNLSLSRTFNIVERFRLQFRADASNVSNTPHFGLPGGNVSNLVLNSNGTVKNLGGFSQITSVQEINDVNERQINLTMRLSF